jgi:hypothetical protein
MATEWSCAKWIPSLVNDSVEGTLTKRQKHNIYLYLFFLNSHPRRLLLYFIFDPKKIQAGSTGCATGRTTEGPIFASRAPIQIKTTGIQ